MSTQIPRRTFLRGAGTLMALPLLEAMLPDIPPSEAYAQLEALPFVERASDGLLIHDLVQQAFRLLLQLEDVSANLIQRAQR